MKRFTAALLMTIMGAGSSWAVPQLLNFQGRIHEDGASDGPRDMTFRIFNDASGGAALFTESHTGAGGVAVAGGVFNALIGSLTAGGIPLAVFDGSDKYLEVQVGRDALPRQRITSVGYAMHSAVADQALSLGGASGSTVTVTNLTVNNFVATSAVVAGNLNVSVGADGVYTSAVNNAITFTQPSGSPAPLIRTALPGQQNNFTDTGATPISLNAGGGGNLFLNPSSTGAVILSQNPASNVGIGDSNPAMKLSVVGDAFVHGRVLAGGDINMFNPPGGSSRFVIFDAAGTHRLELNVSPPGNTGTLNTNSNLQIVGGGGILMSAGVVDAVRIRPDNQNVQIGQGSQPLNGALPPNKLTVAGNASIGVSYATTSAPTDGLIVSGNAGVGTTNPIAKLEVDGTGPSWAFEVSTSPAGQGSPAFRVNDDGSVALGGPPQYLVVLPDGNIDINPGPYAGKVATKVEEPLYITNGGTLGIGTTSPATTVTVQSGDISMRGSGNGLIVKSPDGTKCARIGIDNTGSLTSTPTSCP